jgi:hypothetical protein
MCWCMTLQLSHCLRKAVYVAYTVFGYLLFTQAFLAVGNVLQRFQPAKTNEIIANP